MNYESGKLICPQCKKNGMGNYTNWISREVFNGKVKIKQWIFYYKKNKCICECGDYKCRKKNWIFLFFERYWNGSCYLLNVFFCSHYYCCDCMYESSCKKSNFLRVKLFFYFIFYITLFWIIDLIRFLSKFFCKYKYDCCNGNIYHYNAGSGEKEIYLSICSSIKSIWEKETNQGLTENFWINNGSSQSLFMCRNCYYNPNTFIDFIKDGNDISINISENIAINITTIDTQIHCPIPCNPNELFSKVINKFYRLYPDYKNKECLFLSSGQILDPNLTLSKNGIKNGVNIILMVNDERNSEVTSISKIQENI